LPLSREKTIGFCVFEVKTTCVFTSKNVKSRSGLGARMVQPWYGLGASKVENLFL